MTDTKKILNIALLTGWAIAFAYYFGQLLWFVMPLPWPFNVIASYVSGIVAGTLLAYLVIGRVKGSTARIVLPVVALAFVGVVSVTLNQISRQTTIMSIQIQELRDNAALDRVNVEQRQ
jgi:hypothetical protein